MVTLSTSGDFAKAVENAHDLADLLADAGGAETDQLDHLLSGIVAFHDAQPASIQAENLEHLQALDARLRAFGHRWPRRVGEAHDDHWSPMLGGEIVAARPKIGG